MIVEGLSYSEAWCEECGWRAQGRSRPEVERMAEQHEHPTLGQEISLWWNEP